jgi:exopolysaccharide biosynthesis polyprenyl glycosylphosphotransferase
MGATAQSTARVESPTPEAVLPTLATAPESVPNRRIALQQRATGTIRRHAIRAASRFLVLVAADLGTFIAVRALLRAARDGAALGEGTSAFLSQVLPRGFLGGWQYAAALLIGLALARTYEPGDRRRDTKRVFLGVALATGLALWNPLWVQGVATVAVQYVSTVVLMGTALSVVRGAVDGSVSQLGARVLPRERILFVGDPSREPTRGVAERLLGVGRMELVGWVGDDRGAEPRSPGSMPALGSVAELWDVVSRTDLDSVVVCERVDGESFDLIAEAAAAAGLRLIAPSRYEGIGRLRPTLVWYYRSPFVELTVPALRGHHLLLKRVVDLAASAVGIVLLAPVLAVIGALVKLDSPGPVFFGQSRVGHGGRIFRMWKFRTMRDGADADKGSVAHLNQTGDPRLFKIPDDPRVTRVGGWLRRWSLDELPQFWNVLVGDMSLVGPRPFFESDLAGYSDHHFVRLGAKPGITGLWQVKGRSSVVDFEEVVRLDREYIERWSIWMDLRILLATVPAVVRRTGAF